MGQWIKAKNVKIKRLWKTATLKGFSAPIISTSTLGFLAMSGQLESWNGRDPLRASTSVKVQMRSTFCFTRAPTRKLVCFCLGSWKMKNLFQRFVTTGLFPCRFGDWTHTIYKHQKVLRINEKLVQSSPVLKAPLACSEANAKILWRTYFNSSLLGFPQIKAWETGECGGERRSNTDLSSVTKRHNTENGKRQYLKNKGWEFSMFGISTNLKQYKKKKSTLWHIVVKLPSYQSQKRRS